MPLIKKGFETDEKGGKVFRVYFKEDFADEEKCVTACPECELPYPDGVCNLCGVKICTECMAAVELRGGKVCRPCLLGG